MRIVREDSSGPAASATPFKSQDALPASAYVTNYCLASGIWGRDISKAHRLAVCLETGTGSINCVHAFDPRSPAVATRNRDGTASWATRCLTTPSRRRRSALAC